MFHIQEIYFYMLLVNSEI